MRRVYQQRQQIAAQVRNLKAKTDELTQITDHMNEGLVLLDSGGKRGIRPAGPRGGKRRARLGDGGTRADTGRPGLAAGDAL